MMGYNSLFITITSNNNTQAFKKEETIIERDRKLDMKGISHNYMITYDCFRSHGGLLLSKK